MEKIMDNFKILLVGIFAVLVAILTVVQKNYYGNPVILLLTTAIVFFNLFVFVYFFWKIRKDHNKAILERDTIITEKDKTIQELIKFVKVQEELLKQLKDILVKKDNDHTTTYP